MPDHVHMPVSISPKISVSSFMGYLKGKSSLMMFDRHANLKYKFGNRHFWAEGYYVSTVGLNDATVRKYIQDRERADILQDKMSVKRSTRIRSGRSLERIKGNWANNRHFRNSRMIKASAFWRWLVMRAYSPHPEPPVLRVGAILGSQYQWRITVFNIIMMERKSILTKYIHMIIIMYIIIWMLNFRYKLQK